MTGSKIKTFYVRALLDFEIHEQLFYISVKMFDFYQIFEGEFQGERLIEVPYHVHLFAKSLE